MRNDNLKVNDIFWNTLGTCTYSAVSLVISLIIINLTGKIEGGIFSFGFSTLARLVFTGTFFGIRPMHIVDIKYRYSFNDYVRFGIKTAFISLICGLAFIAYRYIGGFYTSIKSLLLIALVIHGAIDGFADYFECEYQRVNKLNMSGQSIFFRILAFTLTLILTLYITNSLLLAEILAILAEIIAFYILNVKRSVNVFKTAKLQDRKEANLLYEAMPLFIVTFLDIYIFSSAKLAVDANLNDIASGFFALLFMPTNAIYLLMTLFMKPLLTPLSNAYHSDKKGYNKILLNTFLLALCISVAFVIGTIFLGKYYINAIYFLTHNNYYEYSEVACKLLLIVIVGGCFYTLCTPMYFSLIVENKQNYLLVAYVIVAAMSFYLAPKFTADLGILGAAYGFCLSMLLIFIGVIVAKAFTLIIK